MTITRKFGENLAANKTTVFIFYHYKITIVENFNHPTVLV